MRRRSILALVAGSLTGVAGCTADSGNTTNAKTSSPQRTSTEPTSSRRPETEADDAEPSLDVELQTVNHVTTTYRLSEGRGIDPDDIVSDSDVPQVLRDPLLDAVDDSFTTDSVSEEFRAAIDEFRDYDRTALKPYVRLDGTAYTFDPTVPTFVGSLADEELDDPPAERVRKGRDFESEAVESFVDAVGAWGTHNPRAEYRTSVVPDSVEAFLDQYDYVEDSYGVSRIVTDRVDTDPPYTIEARELTDEDLWGNPVVDEADLDEDLRDFFLTAIESDHRAPATGSPTRSEYFTDEVPDAYFERDDDYDSTPYFRLNGTVYGIGIATPDYEQIPVSVATEALPGSDEEGGESRQFELTVTPSTDETTAEVAGGSSFTFTSNGALPSVLWVVHDDDRHLLESDSYDRSRWYSAEESDGDKRPANEVLEIRDLGQDISATYTVPAELPDGTYVSRGRFSVSWNVPNQVPGERALYPFRLRVTVTS